jgi:CelD/BcsL family acetyltransferase involved in cellulose biosynthesis
MEHYFASLSKNERKNRRKYELRLLKKEYEAKVEVLSDPAKVQEEYEQFVRQHTLHWRAQGKPGHFGAWPKATEYNRALVKAQGWLGRLRFVRILANGQVVANQYAFAFGSSYSWELPARAVGPEWERFSLGPTGIVTMIEAAISEGKTRLEGGMAHYDYKVRLGAREYPVKRIRVVRNRCSSRVRAAIFGLIRLGLRYGYHKIWYRRVAPHLPGALKRPQWNFWLRLDF